MSSHFAGLVASLVAASFAIQGSANASETFANKGQIEVGGTLGFTSSTRVTAGATGDATTTVALSPFVGYFLFDEFELGLHLQVNSTSLKGNTSSDYTVLLSPAWNFQLRNSVVTPTIAALIGYGSATNTAGNSFSGVSYGGRFTAKIQVVSRANLHVGMEYLMNTRNASGYSGSRNGENVLNLEVGFTVFFN